ncbi:MAG TPA: TetR/AcrR family transcriptional regulator [Roseomonas sp.]
MARPLSEEKRDAILAAAATLVAAEGTGAPTARIARAAGISEGALFTYFATKDALLNQLYLEIEAGLAGAMLDDYPWAGSARDRMRHLWDRFLDWGAADPVRRRALKQLKVSERITAASKSQSEVSFRDIKAMLEQGLAGHVAPNQDMGFVRHAFGALAEMTLDYVADRPGEYEARKRAGFELLWKGIAA